MTHRRSDFAILHPMVLIGLLGVLPLGCTRAPISTTPQAPAPQATPHQDQAEVSPTPSPSASPEAPITAPAASPADSPAAKRPAASTAAKPDIPEQAKAISSVNADWNGDGIQDTALLVKSEAQAGTVDLLIYLSQAPHQAQLALRKEGIVWSGTMHGTEPSLSLNGQGSLEINSRNDAIGRNRWQQKITALYENSAFIVAGYTYTSRDTLDLAAGGTCDVNLLTGKGIKNYTAFKTDTRPLNLANWTDDSAPEECRS